MIVYEIVMQDPVIIFLPSDHYIPDDVAFKKVLFQAITTANNSNDLVLIGINPDYPATGYGYIELGNKYNNFIFDVKNFKEKPDLKTATEYLLSENVLWNSGIFCAKLSVFLNAFKNLVPEIYNNMGNYFNNKFDYSNFPDISFDYAILEKIKNIKVVQADFKWSDVGTLDLFIGAKKIENKKKQVLLDSSNNIIDVEK